ncbi:hypothetical protein L5515_000181 [Caenorhabditis briggsae]|uniref:Uncharacterized protein n=1 Tax=Caenorhabditis briggsae TaxID=6238 RepID=A0AAE9J1H0_CAEBR|nr:hypothetical protein L5515_000181 [Caenorhabditis briggsae]
MVADYRMIIGNHRASIGEPFLIVADHLQIISNGRRQSVIIGNYHQLWEIIGKSSAIIGKCRPIIGHHRQASATHFRQSPIIGDYRRSLEMYV